ncbi:hypothetical protein Tco_0895952 [Tanacetum coccineum]|uniref:Uncharacterized protein n=1 Tax=Tanacetum coccineum TaxID=301880 RepID=A0ABQ5CGE9_9ASTR
MFTTLMGKELKASEIFIDDEELSDHGINDDGCDVDKEEEWVEYEEPLDLVDINEESIYESLIEKMLSCSLNFDFRIEKGDPRNMSHVMDFTILENIEANIDLDLSQVVFGRPFVEITKLILDMEQGLITFTDGIKEVTFKISYKDFEIDDLTSEGHELLSSRVILSEDDFRRGCERVSDLESGFYKDIDKLGPSYKEEIERIDLMCHLKLVIMQMAKELRKECDSESSYKTR